LYIFCSQEVYNKIEGTKLKNHLEGFVESKVERMGNYWASSPTPEKPFDFTQLRVSAKGLMAKDEKTKERLCETLKNHGFVFISMDL
jgi:hypothetical protein